MLTAAIYLVTAIATGAQVYWLVAWRIWGAPTSPAQYVSLCGSLLLLTAAVPAARKPRTAAFMAVGACAAIWCFYAPALMHTFGSLPPAMPVYLMAWAFVPVVMLVISTIHAVIGILRPVRRLA